MPDFQSFSIIPESASNINVPRYTINALIVEGETILNDFTGDNSISFPSCLCTLSIEQRETILQMVATQLVLMKAGLD